MKGKQNYICKNNKNNCGNCLKLFNFTVKILIKIDLYKVHKIFIFKKNKEYVFTG